MSTECLRRAWPAVALLCCAAYLLQQRLKPPVGRGFFLDFGARSLNHNIISLPGKGEGTDPPHVNRSLFIGRRKGRIRCRLLLDEETGTCDTTLIGQPA